MAVGERAGGEATSVASLLGDIWAALAGSVAGVSLALSCLGHAMSEPFVEREIAAAALLDT